MAFIDLLTFADPPGLYLASYESESPENQVEKDRWKALR